MYKTCYSLPHKKLNVLGYYHHQLCLAKKMLKHFVFFRIVGLLQSAQKCTEQGHSCTCIALYMSGEEERWANECKANTYLHGVRSIGVSLI